MVGENFHNGAHFPLLVCTNNLRARSQEASIRRASNKADWYNGECTAFAVNTGRNEPAYIEFQSTKKGEGMGMQKGKEKGKKRTKGSGSDGSSAAFADW